MGDIVNLSITYELPEEMSDKSVTTMDILEYYLKSHKNADDPHCEEVEKIMIVEDTFLDLILNKLMCGALLNDYFERMEKHPGKRISIDARIFEKDYAIALSEQFPEVADTVRLLYHYLQKMEKEESQDEEV